MGKQWIASNIMFAKRLQEGDEEGVAVDVDDDHAGGRWSQPEAIPAAFAPFKLLRRRTSDSLFMCFRSPPRNASRSQQRPFL